MTTFMRSFMHDDEEESSRTQNSYDTLLAAINFNLYNLFSNEAPMTPIAEALTEMRHSIMRFGIEDMQSLNYQAKKQDFIYNITQLINVFEPRIKNIKVFILDRNDDLSPLQSQTIHFAIEGDVLNGRTFIFDSRLNISDFAVTIENDFG